MYCLKCGSQMADGSKFCVSCGARVENAEPIPETVVQETVVQETVAQEAAVSAESAAVVVEEMAQPAPKPVPPPIQQTSEPAQPTVQPAQPTVQPAPVSQPAPVTQPRPAVQPKPMQPAYSQTAPQQPAQPVQQNYTNVPQTAPQPAMPQKPEKITPLPVWKYIGIFLIMAIPIINIIMLFVWAFGSSFNRNTKNFARSFLIMALIWIILIIAGYFTIWANIQQIMYDVFPAVQLPTIN